MLKRGRNEASNSALKSWPSQAKALNRNVGDGAQAAVAVRINSYKPVIKRNHRAHQIILARIEASGRRYNLEIRGGDGVVIDAT